MAQLFSLGHYTHITFMKTTSTKRRVGRVLIGAAFGAGVFTCAMLITNFHIQSGAYGVGNRIPGWVDIFTQLQAMPYSFVLRVLHLSGSSGSEFCILASIADGLAAFLFLLVPAFLWQLFKCYEDDHRTVA